MSLLKPADYLKSTGSDLIGMMHNSWSAKTECDTVSSCSDSIGVTNVGVSNSFRRLSIEEYEVRHTEDRVKLDYGQLNLCGREYEVDLLREAYKRVTYGASEVIFVHGKGGVGKTTLVETSLRNFVCDCDGYFVTGRFDEPRGSIEPYAALMSAFSDIVELIIANGELDGIREAMRASMGDDAIVLCKLIANLSTVAQLQATQKKDLGNSITNGNMASAFTRLKLLCRSFLKLVSTREHPICLFLDDLHHADDSSLEIIKTILSETISPTACSSAPFKKIDYQKIP
jgi:hypothetical protein